MADRDIELGRFKFNVDDVLKSATELKSKLDELREAQKVMTSQGETSSTAFVQNAANIKELNTQYNDHVKIIQSSIGATTTQVEQENLLTLALNNEVTTIKEARDNNRLLNKLRNETNVTTDEGRAKIKLLNDRLDQNNELIKDNADQYLKQKINIGNYASALGGISPQLASIIGQLKSMHDGLVAQRTAFQASTAATNGASKALNIFKVALAATGIGLIVLALAALVSYLTTTQAGIDKVTSVTRPLQAIFQTLIGVLQTIGETMFNAFSTPKKSAEDLYNFIKTQVMRQFEAFYNILVGIATLDFEQAKEGFTDLGNQASEAFNKVKNSVTEFGNAMVEAAEKGAEIDRLQKSIEQREIDIIGLRASTTSELLKQENIVKNQLLTDEERAAAIQETERLARTLVDAENAILQEQIKQLEIKQSLNDTSRDDLKILEELKAKMISNSDIIARVEKKNLGATKQLEDKRTKDAQKATDDAIKRQEQLLELYISEQGVRAKTIQEELTDAELVSEKKKAILKRQLDSQKITETQYRNQILQLDNDLIARRAELAVENAAEQLRIYREDIQRRLETNEFMSGEVALQRQRENEALLAQQIEFERTRLEQGVISQTEYDIAVREAQERTRLENLEIDKERLEIEREEAKIQRALDFEAELERLELEKATKLEIEQARAAEQRRLETEALEQDRANSLISEELYRSQLARIDSKYKSLEIQRQEILEKQKFAAITGAIGAVASVVDKNSGAGKALALAQALMNTYQGISAGVKLGYPQAIPAVAAAAATGFKAVKDISSQKLPSMATTGGEVAGGGAGQGMGADMSNILGKNVNLNQIAASGNSAVQNQIENQATMNGMSDRISEAVEQGSMRGTSRGAEEGMTNLSDNRQVQLNSEF